MRKHNVTESDGSYDFKDLQPGEYTITHTAPEHFPNSGLVMGKGAVRNPIIVDYAFQDLVLGEATNARDFDFIQLRPNFSKRSYLSSWF